MSIAVNVLSLCRSEGSPNEATAASKQMIMSALEESWPGDHILPVSVLESNLDGLTRALVHAAINELWEAGAIEFAYSEGWSVGVRLTPKDLAHNKLAYSRNTGRSRDVTMASKTAFLASAIDRPNMMTRILGLLRSGGRTWLDGVYVALKLCATQTRFRFPVTGPRKGWFSTVSERQFRGRELERKAFIESMVRLTVAR